MDKKRICILCQEFPYPANHGGAIDTWNRIKGLKKLGHSVQLLVWKWNNRLNDEPVVVRALQEYVSEIIIINRSFPTPSLIFSYPVKMLSYKISGKDFNRVVRCVKEFAPDFFLLDGWGPYLCLLQLQKVFGVPYYYRSHNIEFLYLKEVFDSFGFFGRIKLYLNLGPMKKVEVEIRSGAVNVFDICGEDQNFWSCFKEGEHHENSKLLYPTFIVNTQTNKPHKNLIKGRYILYVGSLWNPNNISGLLWFMNNIVKQTVDNATFPKQVKIVFAGSRPNSMLSNHVLVKQGIITLFPDISESEKVQLMNNAELFINPVQRSQGINIKMIEMLHYNKPIVSTFYGIRGLPDSLKKAIFTTNDQSTFAQYILEILENKENFGVDNTEVLKPYFQIDQLKFIW